MKKKNLRPKRDRPNMVFLEFGDFPFCLLWEPELRFWERTNFGLLALHLLWKSSLVQVFEEKQGME